MGWAIDIILIVILLGGITLGFFSGFIWQFSRFVFLILAVYITLIIHEPLADWLSDKVNSQFVAQLIIYLFVFLIMYLIMFFISWFVEKAVEKVKLKLADQIFGGIFGLLKSALICGFVLLGLIYYPAFGIATLKNSFLTVPVLKYTRNVIFFMPKTYRDKIQYFVRITKNNIDKPEQKETAK
ncbi:MAG: CvpA family protein [Planctomycetes bacterium]|nr:CvpA family protein [Planctomycetota bacterium]